MIHIRIKLSIYEFFSILLNLIFNYCKNKFILFLNKFKGI